MHDRAAREIILCNPPNVTFAQRARAHYTQHNIVGPLRALSRLENPSRQGRGEYGDMMGGNFLIVCLVFALRCTPGDPIVGLENPYRLTGQSPKIGNSYGRLRVENSLALIVLYKKNDGGSESLWSLFKYKEQQ